MTRIALLLTLTLSLVIGCDALAGPKPRPGTTARPAATAPAAPAVALPASWPKEVGIYPGATLIKHEGNASNQHIDLNTPDQCPAVIAWYKAHLPGFKLEIEEPSTAIFSADAGKLSVSMACNGANPNFVLINSIRLP